MATYSSRIGDNARVQHLPLGKALEQYAGKKNRAALVSLLTPVQQAAANSEFVKALVESGEVYHPVGWTAPEAYRFLREVAVLEAAGIVVRVPDWWNNRRPPRPVVSVSVGARAPSKLGLDAMVDFSVQLTLDGETLTDAERRAILASTDGLILLKGKWVEVDREKLKGVLDRWEAASAKADSDGVALGDAMRLLAGASVVDGDPAVLESADNSEWSKVVAGPWMTEVLEGLRSPEGLRGADPGADVKPALRPDPQTGVRWLWWLYSLGFGACLADDMGLGKTVQVISLLLLVKRATAAKPATHLLVVPASLLANWQSEIQKFAPSLQTLIAHPSARSSSELSKMSEADLSGTDLVITTYGALHRFEWLSKTAWNLAILDEAQAIKNPSARQTRAAKGLKTRGRLALTGTPVENRLGDLWSLFDFVCPGLLGGAKDFGRFTKRLAESKSGYGPLRNLVRPYILRRLKTDQRIIQDLPAKTELRAYCPLTKEQAVLYQQSVDALKDSLERLEGMERRGVVLAFLLRFKQICNHPSQWLGDGRYAPEDSGKFARLRELCEEIASRQERVLVFTQFREMTDPLDAFLRNVFGRPGLVLHGDTAVKEARRTRGGVSARRWAAVLRAVGQSRRHGAQPHRGVACDPLRSLVESRGRESSDRPRISNRAEEERARAQVCVPRDDRRAHRRVDRVEDEAVDRGARGRRRSTAHGAFQRTTVEARRA